MNLIIGSLALSIVGLISLMVGGETLVLGASRIAQRFRIHPAIIGLTIVAFATSVPELCVSIIAIAKSNPSPDIAVGNVFGSNVFNTLMVIGVAAWMMGKKKDPLCVQATVFKRELLECALLTIGIAGLLFLMQENGAPTVPVWLGLLLLAGLVRMLYRLVRDARSMPVDSTFEEEEPPTGLILWALGLTVLVFIALQLSAEHFPLQFSSTTNLQILLTITAVSLAMSLRSTGMIGPLILGLATLIAGSNLLVVGAQGLALEIGLTDAVIALVGIAIGTSAPELATTISAVRRNDVDMAVGNAVGSNLFNLLAVLGGTSVTHGILNHESTMGPLNPRLPWDALVAGLALVLVLVVARKAPHILSKSVGALMILAWFIYLTSMAWEPQVALSVSLP
jgi:cation:H+ antiporter